MSTDTPGIVAATHEEAERQGKGDARRQLGMLPDAHQLNLYREANGGRIDTDGIAQIRGRGRPAGSRNRRNQKIAQLITHKFGDPMDGLGNLSIMPLEDAVAMVRHADDVGRAEELDRLEEMVDRLARRLRADDDQTSATALTRQLVKFMARKQISAIDVLNLQVRVGQDLMTYVHGRQPISVDVREKVDAVLIIPGVNAPADASHEQLQAAVNRGGLDAIDFDNMRILTAPGGDAVEADDGDEE